MARHPDVQYVRFYTDGSAARKVAVAAPIKTMRLPRVKKQKRVTLWIDPLALTAIVMTVVMAVLMIVGVVQLNAAQQETITMRNHVEKLQQESAELHSYFNENCDMDEIERTALALGMVPKSQVSHQTIRVPQETVVEQPDVWERFITFLTGLFA